jgi:hypothetical protein
MFILILLPLHAEAIDTNLQREIQQNLRESSALIKKAEAVLSAGRPFTSEISTMKTKAEHIRSLQLLLNQKFSIREEEIKTKCTKAQKRHKNTEEGYRDALEEYLTLIDSLPPDGSISQSQLEKLRTFLDNILHNKGRPLHGSLPYIHLNYPSKEPNTDPAIIPAYKGGNKVVAPEDTGETEEAPISEEIAELAQSLHWNPVSIYEYVKNTIETEWYWGCMKGAEETLHQKSGNDCDQATLLVALLRASGFPSRYVRGTMEFFAGRDAPIDKVKNLMGIEDPWKTAEFLRKAGIPFKPVMTGGTIANFQIEHIWVESQIPYANYRGTVIDGQGKTWLGIDTSIKVKDYQYNNPTDIYRQSAISTQLSAIRDEYLNSVQTQTPWEYLEAKLSALGYQLSDIMRTKTLTPEVMNILPASMQFDQKKITHEYTGIPDELRHKVRFTANDMNNKELFNITFDTMDLSNQKIALTSEPETVEDQEIIDSYGGLDNTPSYLVRLRPVLTIDEEMVVAGKDGLPMGEDYNFTIELISPNGVQKITSTHITGNLTAIGIVAQKAISNQLSAMSEDDDVEEILFKETQNYINRWNQAEEELASLMHLAFTRPIPTVVTIGGVIDVTYLMDMPHGYEWKGEYCDANLRTIEAVGADDNTPSAGERQKTFMQLSALQGSILENRIFEDDFQVDSISTAKLFGIAPTNQTPLLTIDKTNISTVLSALPFDDNIKEDITNAVNQNLTVTIPNQEITYKDWTGIGYVKENPETKEAGYMLSGMIAGGMTAVSPDKWTIQSLREKFNKPHKDYKSVIITSPRSGAIASIAFIEVKGNVLDPTASVEVNGIPAVVEGNTFTATGIMLKDGANNITATATNAAGRTTSDTVFITYKVPIMTYITFPYDGAELSDTPIDVEGIVSDPAASVEVNGISALVRGDGRFIAFGISLSEGSTQITANATKSDGHAGSYTINVNYHTATVQPMSLSITSPTDNATISKPSVIVKGTVRTSAQEVSIKVNGIVADVYGNQFVANNVPLTEGSNAIIVNALDSNGAVGRTEMSVTAVTTASHITLSSNITSGIPPLTAYFSVSTEIPNLIVHYEMDFEGDGVIDYTGSTFEDFNYTSTTEGIYSPTLTVTDIQGNTYSDTIAITMLNKAHIDALLKGKWEGMKEALTKGEIEGALKYFIGRSKERYRSIFSALKDQFPSILQTFVEFNIANVFDNIAEYEIVVNETGSLYSYPGIFIRGGDGIWRFNDF